MIRLYLSCALLLFCLNTHAQTRTTKKQGGYMSLRGGPSFKDGTTKAIASVSVGFSDNNTFGIGGGFGYINYDRPYIPLTADISFFGIPGKISPVIIAQAGYGVYNYTTNYTVGRGGFTGSLNAGVGFPLKGKNKIIITAGYYTYGFTTTTKINNGATQKVASKDNRLAVTFGFKI